METATEPEDPLEAQAKYEGSDLARKNLIALDIFYERIGYYKHYQIEAVPSSSLVSDIGGQVGLWLGISIISIYEILQVAIIHMYRSGFDLTLFFCFLHIVDVQTVQTRRFVRFSKNI